MKAKSSVWVLRLNSGGPCLRVYTRPVDEDRVRRDNPLPEGFEIVEAVPGKRAYKRALAEISAVSGVDSPRKE